MAIAIAQARDHLAADDSTPITPARHGMRMALTHDYLDQYGGAERTVLALCEQFPSVPLYTSVYERAVMRRLGFVEG